MTVGSAREEAAEPVALEAEEAQARQLREARRQLADQLVASPASFLATLLFSLLSSLSTNYFAISPVNRRRQLANEPSRQRTTS